MSTLSIAKVTALPLVYAANTLYLLAGAAPDVVELYLSSNDGSSVRHIPTKEDVLSSSVIFSATTPSTDTASRLWWNMATAALFIRYDDGTTVSWVEAIPSIAVPEFGGNGTDSTMARSNHWHDTIVLQKADW